MHQLLRCLSNSVIKIMKLKKNMGSHVHFDEIFLINISPSQLIDCFDSFNGKYECTASSIIIKVNWSSDMRTSTEQYRMSSLHIYFNNNIFFNSFFTFTGRLRLSRSKNVNIFFL
jgi:hypothetical protein